MATYGTPLAPQDGFQEREASRTCGIMTESHRRIPRQARRRSARRNVPLMHHPTAHRPWTTLEQVDPQKKKSHLQTLRRGAPGARPP